jgi:hypothetical protein
MQVTMPWNNLGALRISFKSVVLDLYLTGLVVNDGVSLRHYFMGKLESIQVRDFDRIEPIFRRTMYPGAALITESNEELTCLSFPCQPAKGGSWYIYARSDRKQPSRLRFVRCDKIRPINYPIFEFEKS